MVQTHFYCLTPFNPYFQFIFAVFCLDNYNTLKKSSYIVRKQWERFLLVRSIGMNPTGMWRPFLNGILKLAFQSRIFWHVAKYVSCNCTPYQPSADISSRTYGPRVDIGEVWTWYRFWHALFWNHGITINEWIKCIFFYFNICCPTPSAKWFLFIKFGR